MVGIYGKSNVKKASRYEDLVDHWCVEATVDFLVGAGLWLDSLIWIKFLIKLKS